MSTFPFQLKQPSVEDSWRGIILYGRNVQSYKFALASALLELDLTGSDLVRLDDLAPLYAKHLCNHLLHADKQGTARSSKFLDLCREFNSGEKSKAQLLEGTVSLGFNNVIDAFHIVGGSPTEQRFFLDERRESGGIRITADLQRLSESDQFANLPLETDARWRLVEAAWELNVSRSLVSVRHDPVSELFFTHNHSRRRDITSSRNALMGYQMGHCFYCFDQISLEGEQDRFPDVDHFLPHVLKSDFPRMNIDGVWNLVLACRACNRGVAGKFEKIPKKFLLERLHTRNEFLIGSNHPLKETLIQQTGDTTAKRTSFLKDAYETSWARILSRWSPELRGPKLF